MKFPGKVTSITLITLLGIGGVGVASAAFLPTDNQNNITEHKSVVNTPISQASNKINQVNANTKAMNTNTISEEQMNALHDNWLELVDSGSEANKDNLYNKMVAKDQQLMRNVTREQMLELDKAWMEQKDKQHQTMPSVSAPSVTNNQNNAGKELSANQTSTTMTNQSVNNNNHTADMNENHSFSNTTSNQSTDMYTNHSSNNGKHNQTEQNHQGDMSQEHQNDNHNNHMSGME